MGHDDDDLDFLRGNEGLGGGLGAVLQIVVGAVLFSASLIGMFYETEMALGSHDLHTFQIDFLIILLVGLPVLIIGVWLFNRGRRGLRR